MKPKVPFEWRGKHHSYFGVGFIAFGLFFLYMDYNDPDRILWLWESIIIIGGYMIFDDFVEHNITASTPLRILYIKIILPLIRKNR